MPPRATLDPDILIWTEENNYLLVDIEILVNCYKEGVTIDEIMEMYGHYLTEEEIFATLTYYYANREKVEDYVLWVEKTFQKFMQEQERQFGPNRLTKEVLEERFRKRKEAEKADLSNK